MTTKKNTDINNLNFEQALAELENIVSALESGQAGLDTAMELYSRGQELKEYCSKKLTEARMQVERITDNGGNSGLTAFDVGNS